MRIYTGAWVAQWAKRWPADLAVSGSSPAGGENLLSCKRLSLHKVFRYHPLIVLKHVLKCC